MPSIRNGIEVLTNISPSLGESSPTRFPLPDSIGNHRLNGVNPVRRCNSAPFGKTERPVWGRSGRPPHWGPERSPLSRRDVVLRGYRKAWRRRHQYHTVLKTFGRTRLTIPVGGMRSINLLTMSSGRTPSASALKLVRMRCRRTGAATDCTSSIPA